MLLGLIGDIHGNDAALAATLDAARKEGVQTLLITGDLVGYYHRPAMVLDLLKGWNCHVVRGNHEDMLTRTRDTPDALTPIEKKYGSALRSALTALSHEQLDYLCNLPHPLELELDRRRIMLCHGSPWDNDQYIYPDAPPELLRRCTSGGHDLVVLGHTHYAMLHKIGHTTIVNPGSVGQQRDRQPGAAWALYDSISGEVTFRREHYDASPIIAEAKERDPGLDYLATVLIR